MLIDNYKSSLSLHKTEDKEYRFALFKKKMYVVRPQFFIQLIGLLRNAALNSLKYKQELALVREQNIDITHFEDDL